MERAVTSVSQRSFKRACRGRCLRGRSRSRHLRRSAQLRTVGLAEGAVREAQERVKSAIKNSGYEFPNRKITINLAPADTRKEGSAFDLPIALAILAANGALRRASGCAITWCSASSRSTAASRESRARCRARCSRARNDYAGVMLPRENAAEASVVGDGMAVLGVETLREAFEFFEGLREIRAVRLQRRRSVQRRQPLRRRFQRGEGPGAGQARARSRRRRRSQRPDDRAAGLGQDDARQAAADDPAGDDLRGGDRDHQGP